MEEAVQLEEDRGESSWEGEVRAIRLEGRVADWKRQYRKKTEWRAAGMEKEQ